MSAIDYMIPLEALMELAKAFGAQICPECAKQYEPAASVILQYTRFPFAHISPKRFYITKASLANYRATRCCESAWRSPRDSTGEGNISLAHHTHRDLHFIEHLLLRYPKLKNKPITLRTLQEAGCNLEAEIAMWQLAKEGDGEQ